MIELKSPSDRIEDLKEKMEEWVKNGTELAWMINPEIRETTVFSTSAEPLTVKFSETLFGGKVLPELEIVLKDLFFL